MTESTAFTEFDKHADRLLADWLPIIGPPTCGKGCSNCCRVAVAASSGEALRLLEFMQGRPLERAQWFADTVQHHVQKLVDMFVRQGVTTNPLADIWKMGACPFLVERCCGIYEARPFACRAVHVWHDNRYCGTARGQIHVPAELFEQRDVFFWQTMRREVDLGRRPFYGQLTVVLYYLMRHGNAYLEGRDLRELIDPPWLETRLIQFVGDGPLKEVGAALDQTLREVREVYRQEHPYGLPRVSRLESIAELHPSDEEKAQTPSASAEPPVQ